MNDCVPLKKELMYLVKIIYKIPDAVVYKNMKATEYPRFTDIYPDTAFKKRLIVDRIQVIKEFDDED